MNLKHFSMLCSGSGFSETQQCELDLQTAAHLIKCSVISFYNQMSCALLKLLLAIWTSFAGLVMFNVPVIHSLNGPIKSDLAAPRYSGHAY